MRTDRQVAAKAVVITGASSGIGAACALRLDELGWRVFAGVRRESDGAALRLKTSTRLSPVLLDVTGAASIAAAVEAIAVTVEGNGLAGIVNNAGIATAGPLEFLPIDELRKQFEVNVIGQIAVTQAFLPLLRRGQGRVVNIGSLGGRIAMPFVGPYSATKFAMEALTDSLRIELRPWGIPVSIIEPGFIATPIWQRSAELADASFKSLPQQANLLYGDIIPSVREIYSGLGRTGTPVQEVARVIIHALTAPRPKTRYLVGRGSRLGTAVLERLPDKLRDALIVWWLTRGNLK